MPYYIGRFGSSRENRLPLKASSYIRLPIPERPVDLIDELSSIAKSESAK